MILVWILLGLVLLVSLLLLLRCDLHLVYETEFSATLHLLFLRFPLYPKPKKRVNVKDYSPKALEKKRKKAQKKAAKRKKNMENAPERAPKADKPENLLSFIKTFLEAILRRTFGYMRVRTDRLIIRVGTQDPAITALLFGAVNTAALCLLEVLDRFGRWDKTRRTQLEISPDFLATQTTADIHIVLSLRIWQLLAILLRTFLEHLKQSKTENKA